MCQLTYSNLKNPFLNSLMIYLLSTEGSRKHNDGCGIMCADNTIWKSAYAANKITNLGNLLFDHVKGDGPHPFHIRQATYGIEVNKENSHPFDGDNYILMHNGTLIPKNGKENKDKKHDSDSANFLAKLDSVKAENPKMKFVDIFNAAMADFAGKFAFIIRDKDNNNDYIIRGRTAELWISKLEINNVYSGYVINTSDDTIKAVLHDFINIAGLMDGRKYKFSDPVLLKQETIFNAKSKELKEIGETKEETPVKNDITPKIQTPLLEGPKNRAHNKGSNENYVGDIGKLVQRAARIHEFLSEHSLTLIDFQIIMKEIGGISNLEVEMDDLDMFVNHLISKISATKAMRAQVRNALQGKAFPLELYYNSDLEYPWMVNPNDKVMKVLKEHCKA